ncbi:MAG: hypothetical protein HeimC3_00970 [Candidatus Heimdallarchaeota archaeon LC_3]|jgi:hypothetical protein|nr:MAG: hypothetical protein HeimC3_00970 [Candidatus Heimdallarchaeota archaeon LC_3]
MSEDPEDILEKPKSAIVKDLQSYLSQIKLEMNIESFEFQLDEQNFVNGIKLFVKILGVSKPVNIKFFELGFTETRLSKEAAEKIFR